MSNDVVLFITATDAQHAASKTRPGRPSRLSPVEGLRGRQPGMTRPSRLGRVLPELSMHHWPDD